MLLARVCRCLPRWLQGTRCLSSTPDTLRRKLRNAYYAGYRAPLRSTPLVELPLGAVRPQGWLKQLALQAAGFHGHLGEISQFLRKDGNAWLSADGCGRPRLGRGPVLAQGLSADGLLAGRSAADRGSQPVDQGSSEQPAEGRLVRPGAGQQHGRAARKANTTCGRTWSCCSACRLTTNTRRTRASST